MENKKEAENELDILQGLFTRYMDGNLTDEENIEVEEAKGYIDDIISELEYISLDGNVSDKQILTIYDEYRERRGPGSSPLGDGIADVMKQSVMVLPIFLVGYAIHAGIQELEPIIVFAEVCLAHHLLNKGADKF
ncbi:MAG: hypothetical protein C5S48_06790 [Candidatus Methanogaster sp.]|nr:MAG: hypothetical protein C5S48_06790 [ANME-2 cluster archaeon]